MKRILFALLLFSSFATSAKENVSGTYEITFFPVSSQGNPTGCYLGYRAIKETNVYESGAVYAVVGNIGILIADDRKGIIGSLKILVNKMDIKNNKPIFTPKKPYFAYLQTQNGANTTAKSFIRSSDTEQPGGIISVFNLDENFVKVFGQMTETDKVSVVFNLVKNGMDIVVPLDLKIKDTDSRGKKIYDDEAVNNFHLCSRPLFKEVSTNLSKFKK
jgi:hypothetical protein